MIKHKPLPISSTLPEASRIAYGCMGLGGSWNSDPLTTSDIVQAKGVIEAALESGINFFDHADIYTRGKAEQAFGQVIKQSPELRDQMIIQSKCAIRFEDESAPGRYDFSADYFVKIYRAECVCLRLHCNLIKSILDKQVCTGFVWNI